MSRVKLEIELSSAELLKAVEQLNTQELDEFVSQLIILHTHRKSTQLLKDEAELFVTNNQDFCCDQNNYNHLLIAKVNKEHLTEEEYKELLRLSEQIDELQGNRLEYLSKLAHLHGISLIELMKTLGFQT